MASQSRLASSSSLRRRRRRNGFGGLFRRRSDSVRSADGSFGGRGAQQVVVSGDLAGEGRCRGEAEMKAAACTVC